jgi:hypothetical protein
MYTPKEVRVKVADLPDAGMQLFQNNRRRLPARFRNHRLVAATPSKPRGTT